MGWTPDGTGDGEPDFGQAWSTGNPRNALEKQQSPSRSHRQQHGWEGTVVPAQGSVPALGTAPKRKKAPVMSLIISRHFLKRNPSGAEALFSFRAAHDGMCAFALVF